MSEDPRQPDGRNGRSESPQHTGGTQDTDGTQDAGGDSFVDRHLGKIVAAVLLIGLLGVAARALVA